MWCFLKIFFFQPSIIWSLQWSLTAEGTVKIKVLISSKWTQHHLAVVLLSYLVLHQGLNHLMLWYSAVITPLKCACLWVLLFQIIRYSGAALWGPVEYPVWHEKRLINAFKMKLVVLKMVISDSATQPTLFSFVGSISCLKFFLYCYGNPHSPAASYNSTQNAFTFQASCIPLLRTGALPP